jgi:hypothetical protein
MPTVLERSVSEFIETDGSNFGPITFRNRIINGDMEVHQRGTAFTASGVTYTADRFYVAPTGANVTARIDSSAAGVNIVGYGKFRKWLNVVGAAGNTGVTIGQRIEDIHVFDLAGKAVTISAAVYVTAAIPYVSVAVWTADTPNSMSGAKTTRHTSTPSLVPGWNLVTVTIPALHADCINGLEVDFNFPAHTSGDVAITGVQLVEGKARPVFERRPVTLETTLCQRYFYASPIGHLTLGQAFTATLAGGLFRLPVPMRAVPTLGAASLNVTSAGGGAIAVTGIARSTASVDCVQINLTVAAGLVGGDAVYVTVTNVGSYFHLTAEL